MIKLQIHRAGGYEQLQIVEAPDLKPGPGQIKVDVKAVGVNYADCLIRWGVYESAKKYVGWPITPGFEFSGLISELGEGVTNRRVGDKVFGVTLFNAYASQVVVPEHQVFSVPDEKYFLEFAGFPAVFYSAYHALFQIVRLYPNSKILVHSAAGGVGSALVTLAKLRGLHVTGVIGSSKKENYLRKLGVDEWIDKSKTDFEVAARKLSPEGYDAVFDANGFETYQKSYDLLAPTGKLICYGSHSLLPKNSRSGRINYLKAGIGLLKTPRFNPLQMISENKTVCGFNLSFLFEKRHLLNEIDQDLKIWFEENKLKPLATTFFDFKDLAQAHQLIESGQSTGKIVLKL